MRYAVVQHFHAFATNVLLMWFLIVLLPYRGEAGSLEDGESYDWFFGYSRLAVYLNLHVGGARAGRVLVLGCGNSEVSPKMWENGWK